MGMSFINWVGFTMLVLALFLNELFLGINRIRNVITGETADQAVAQLDGFVFAFDRVSGQPIWPIEERPVDTKSEVPGEVVYPTQPFPTKPPPFELQGSTEENLIDFTPELRRRAGGAPRRLRRAPRREQHLGERREPWLRPAPLPRGDRSGARL